MSGLSIATRRRLRTVPLAPVPPPIVLAALPCRACGGVPAVIVAFRRTADLHDEMLAWCGAACARPAGWPFLRGENAP